VNGRCQLYPRGSISFKASIPGDWLREPGGASPATSFATLNEAEGAHIVKALERCGWQGSGERGAAKLLDMSTTTLESRIKRMGLTRPS